MSKSELKPVMTSEPALEVDPIPGGFAPATKEVYDIIASLYESTHINLRRAEVSIGAFFAWAGIDSNGCVKGCAIKLHGCPCYAKIRKTSLQQRVAGMSDAELTIDGDNWPGLTQGQKVALIDHELTHVELIEDDKGKLKLDKAERPKLHMRPHDWELTGFAEVVKRHGSAALEVKAITRFVMGEDGQMVMGFAAPKQLEGAAA